MASQKLAARMRISRTHVMATDEAGFGERLRETEGRTENEDEIGHSKALKDKTDEST